MIVVHFSAMTDNDVYKSIEREYLKKLMEEYQK